jgi:DNA-binding response OmpR family regulator
MRIPKRDLAENPSSSGIRAGILEDDDDLRPLFCRALRNDGITALEFHSGADAISAAISGRIDFLLLDLGLGNVDGLDIVKDLRLISKLPVIVISGRTDVASVCAALDAGADDFLRKPITISEFRARMRSIARDPKPPFSFLPSESFSIAGIRFDLSLGEARGRNHESCKFTDRETIILQCLYKEAGQTVSRDSFARAIFGQCWNPQVRILDVHIANIRSKLRGIGASGQIIRTRRNIGYSIFPDSFKSTPAARLEES